jgi:uncharacterized protein YuzE
MKFRYERETDTLLINLNESEIDETNELRSGVLADFDAEGDLVSLKVLNASSKVADLPQLLESPESRQAAWEVA